MGLSIACEIGLIDSNVHETKLLIEVAKGQERLIYRYTQMQFAARKLDN